MISILTRLKTVVAAFHHCLSSPPILYTLSTRVAAQANRRELSEIMEEQQSS